MPAPAGTKRVKGVSVFRPFVYGSIAKLFDPNARPPGINADHTHQWTLYVRGIDNTDISYWLKKVSFKLHETYTNSLRTVEAPPFEVTETGWGEFEVQIKLYFIPEANEKPQTVWHHLKLHPYGPDAEAQRERRDPVRSQCYEEVMFNEPVEVFYDILTSSGPLGTVGRGKGGSKGSKQASYASKKGLESNRTAELPFEGVYSQKEEGKELDRLVEAKKMVESMVKEEQSRMEDREKLLTELRGGEKGTVKAR